MLVVFGGLPGTGKTSVSRAVADALGATFLRIDAVEAAIQRMGFEVGETPVAYSAAHAVAADQLQAGRTVVVDAVNPARAAREGWADLAREFNVGVRYVEVVCSDAAEHRRRVEARQPDLVGHAVPTWKNVLDLAYEPWDEPRLVLDNLDSIEAGVARVLAAL